MIDSLLLTAARISTFEHQRGLTNASGFFFERDGRLFVVTSRHVLIDEPSGHHPNRIEIEIHTDAVDLGRSTGLSLLLFADGRSVWRQGQDAGGEIDVAMIELDRNALPAGAVLQPLTPAHLMSPGDRVEVGSQVLIVGFPLGFHDTLHHLPVVRQAVVASAYGMRFQGEGYFLTDARTHRGTSGAPVVLRDHRATAQSALPWRLLGVHSARLDMAGRDLVQDETLGLNCAWYADILMTLSEPHRPAHAAPLAQGRAPTPTTPTTVAAATAATVASVAAQQATPAEPVAPATPVAAAASGTGPGAALPAPPRPANSR